MAVKTSVALSKTDGTDCSSCSVALARAMKCGLVTCDACAVAEGEEASGSISRSKMAEDEECLQRVLATGFSTLDAPLARTLMLETMGFRLATSSHSESFLAVASGSFCWSPILSWM